MTQSKKPPDLPDPEALASRVKSGVGVILENPELSDWLTRFVTTKHRRESQGLESPNFDTVVPIIKEHFGVDLTLYDLRAFARRVARRREHGKASES